MSPTILEILAKFERLGVALEIVKEPDTWDAVAKLVLPAWLALIVQVPTVIIVSVVPEIVQTNVVADVNTTDKPEVETAAKAVGLSPKVMSAGKLVMTIDCADLIVAGKTAVITPESAEWLTDVAPVTVKKLVLTPVSV